MKTPPLCLKFWIETGNKVHAHDCELLTNMPESVRPIIVREIIAASSKGDRRRRRKGLLQ